MVERSDIITAQITDEMRTGATQFASAVARLNSRYSVKAVNKHDYYGNLGHQAVENILSAKKLDFLSDTSPQKGPDSFDILFTGDKIDVKSTHRDDYEIDKWWKFQKFLVFEHQIEREVLQQKDSIIFCVVDDPSSSVYVFGGISVHDFLKYAKRVGPDTSPNLKWENREISLDYLTPFWKFIYRA